MDIKKNFDKVKHNKVSKELSEDKKKLIKAFEVFSCKYGSNITGFNIYKIDEANWMLQDIVMNGKLFR